MIKIHGTPISNYYNTAKLALVEKGLEFEEVAVFPGLEPEVLANTPVGKIPWIEIDGQTLCETNVIFDYLEDTNPEPRLYPTDPYARAKVKEILRIPELYLDAHARRHIATVYFGAPVNPAAFEEVRPALENGLKGLKRFAKYGPYIAGSEFTYADITAFFQIRFTNMHTMQIYDWDITKTEPEIGDYLAMLSERKSVAEVDGAMQAAMAAFSKG
jgi:glutathione S-transferase